MEKNLAARMDKLESRPDGHDDEGAGKRHDSEGNEECRGSVLKKLRALPLRTQPPTCQAEKCSADLTNAKDYHRRHKVCEMHSKAPSVLVCGQEQRFCQQCSRFHVLGEFDETKRSCRRRLAGHNERRRKISSDSSADRLDANRRLNESWCRHVEEASRMAMVLDRNPTVNVCKEIKNNGIPQLMFAKR